MAVFAPQKKEFVEKADNDNCGIEQKKEARRQEAQLLLVSRHCSSDVLQGFVS